uniref:BHLH domain-containing protein n=1 Tax=Heterorhabditis bacteriophora TaxID=37862 RepID=A0A1I7XE35_HETBA
MVYLLSLIPQMAFIATPAFSSLYSGNLMSVNQVVVSNTHSVAQTHNISGKRKVVDPFDPEASVPLPYQLDEFPYSTSVWKRNERERFRVRCVNNGYDSLRRHLPVSDKCRCFHGFEEESEGNVQVDMSVKSHVTNVHQVTL